MLLTYKIKHGRDFSVEFAKAKEVAEFALLTKSLSSKDVKHIGLKSTIACQILRKYSRNKKIKVIRSVKLTIPGQVVKNLGIGLYIPCLKLHLDTSHFPRFEKVNQVECDNETAFVTVTVMETPEFELKGFIGIDRNTTGHVAVVGDPRSGKVWKLGKTCHHIHQKYSNIRRRLQKRGCYKEVKDLKHKESKLVRDINHKISKKIVEIAVKNNAGIKMEQLDGIRNRRRQSKSSIYSLHSWSFYQLQEFIEYRAKLKGVMIVYVDPAFTSQQCSRCGLIGEREDKIFLCPYCGHLDHADVNASFNIALRPSLRKALVDPNETGIVWRAALIRPRRLRHGRCRPNISRVKL